MAQPLDLSGPIRTAILANAAITALLAVWEGAPAVFTRRPVPEDGPYPLILVSPDVSISDEDFLNGSLPRVRRDLTVYGEQPDQYRTVESIGYLLRQQFHRQRFAVSVAPWYSVIDIMATGPMEAPTSDERLLGRALPLTFRLQALTT